MPVMLIQNDFTHGEVDETTLSRVDLALYNKSAQRLRNCIITETGAAKKRFGTEHVSNIVFAPTLSDNFQWTSFRLNDESQYIVIFYTNKMDIYKHNDVIGGVTLVFTTATSPYSNALIGAGNLVFSYDDNLLVITHEDVPPYQLVNDKADNLWTLIPIPFKFLPPHDFKQDYDAITFSLSSLAIGTSTLTASSAIFDTSYIGGTFIGAGPSTATVTGIGFITGFTDTTHVTLNIQAVFDAQFTAGVIGTQVFLGQPAWNAADGYPISSAFYEGRLWFGGTRSLPRTLLASVTDDYRNFNVGGALDSDAISASLSGGGGTKIQYLVSDKNIQIFTTGGEFVVPQYEQQVITPTNISARKQDSRGVKLLQPAVIDNATLFVQKGGRSVYSFDVGDNTESYTASSISLTSSHLIVNPLRWDTLQGSDQISSDFLFAANADGTLLSLQLISEENINAWTLSFTSGVSGQHGFKDILNIDNYIYFVIERIINGTPTLSLERMNFDINTDDATLFAFGGPTTALTGLGYLEGETVSIVADGLVLAQQTVPASGNLTMEVAATNVEVGLLYAIEIRPNPVQVQSSTGPTLYLPKNIPRIFVDFYQSLGLSIDGNPIPDLNFSPSFFDAAPELQTGIYEYTNLGGWDRRQAPTISSTEPLSATILGIGYEVII